MEAVVAIIAAGFGAVWWQRLRWARAHRTFTSSLDTDAEVVLHVAQHEARSRSHETLTSFHLLYGLLQDEAMAEAMRSHGGDVEALEDRVLARLDATVGEARVMTEDAQQVLSFALSVAIHGKRKATCIDLWAYLARSEVVPMLEEAKLDPVAMLFTLAHGCREPAISGSGPEVHVALRNDDYTTREFVIEALHTVFGIDEQAAEALTMKIHTEGRAVVARLPAAAARGKILEVREQAKPRAYPLWIASEPT
ncbi:MAG: ATP-dependent Clp protease adaptor ClpS [Deltaproteobacteria bacterium]|nr:ATP-dependent Clp protease adaptor ClpS [Deltaproteobacteria bacterium]